MNRHLTGAVICLLLSFPAQAIERITEAQIRQLMDVTDAAAQNRDAAGIGAHLSDWFVKIIEFEHGDKLARVRLGKHKYLELIAAGWTETAEYDYRRDDIVIYITLDGLSGQSYSTITEHMVRDGEKLTSRFREYATYEMENGRPVILYIEGHTLVGDTTPSYIPEAAQHSLR